jgi:hypothetical protein
MECVASAKSFLGLRYSPKKVLVADRSIEGSTNMPETATYYLP